MPSKKINLYFLHNDKALSWNIAGSSYKEAKTLKVKKLFNLINVLLIMAILLNLHSA
jgi:hypothetical protein